MRDPIEELRGFNPEGLPVNPMPASEVRRRGDRMRRRRNAGAAIAGVAAVTLLTVPLALLADREDDSIQPAPAPSANEPADGWRSEIPDSFPIAGGLPASTVAGADAEGVTVLEYCGTEGWTATADAIVDLGTATFTEPNSHHGISRTLALYPDDRAAGTAMDELRAAVEACGTDPNGTGGPLEVGILERALDADESYFITQNVLDEDGVPVGDVTIVEVVRRGNALFLEESFGLGLGGTEASLQEAADGSIGQTEPVLRAMCLFAADPCETIPEAPAAPEVEGLVDLLPTEAELEWSEEAGWVQDAQSEDEADPSTYDSCRTSALEEMRATDTAQREFAFRPPAGTVAGSGPEPRLWAVVAQFPNAGLAYVAYEQLSAEVLSCADRAVLPTGERADRYEANQPQPLRLEGVEGEARVQFSMMGPLPGDPDSMYLTEHGLAVVGDKLLLLVSRVAGQDYNWENGTPMERSLRNAAPRLAD